MGDNEADSLLLEVGDGPGEEVTDVLLLELRDGTDRLAGALDVVETVGDAEALRAPLAEAEEDEEARELAAVLAVGAEDIDNDTVPLFELLADCVAPLFDAAAVVDTDADGETVPERDRTPLPRGDALVVMLKLGLDVAVPHFVAVAHALADDDTHGDVVAEGLALCEGADGDAAPENEAAGVALTLLQSVAEADALTHKVRDGLPLGVEERVANSEALAQIDGVDDTVVEPVTLVVRRGVRESPAVPVALLRTLSDGMLEALTPEMVGAALCDEDARFDAESVMVALAHSLEVNLVDVDGAALPDVLPKMLLEG